MLEDSFDLEGMQAGMKDFKRLTDAFHHRLASCCTDYLLLSNEGCGRCEKCTYPLQPCRFPEMLHHSLEGYGLMVYELAGQAKMPYHNGAGTATFFGAVCFHEPDMRG